MAGVPADAATDDEDGITLEAIAACRREWLAEYVRLAREVEQARGRVQACDYLLAQAARVLSAAERAAAGDTPAS